jgi:hypothetical protein
METPSDSDMQTEMEQSVLPSDSDDIEMIDEILTIKGTEQGMMRGASASYLNKQTSC